MFLSLVKKLMLMLFYSGRALCFETKTEETNNVIYIIL